MSTYNKAKRVIERLVGEAYDLGVNQEFRDLVRLLQGIRKCSRIGDGEICLRLLDNYVTLHGDELVHDAIAHANSTRMVTDDYFADILQDILARASEAIKAGQLVGDVKALEDAAGYPVD